MIRREILFPEKNRRLKSLHSLKSSPGALSELASSLPSKPGLPAHNSLNSIRSLSFGNSPNGLRRLPETFPHRKEDYELISECGQGATAKVWRAFCKPLQEEVAIKIVDLEGVGSNLDTIIHEAHVMSSLRHPNVLGLLACFVEDHYLWMVLPYISGGSVESAMNYAFPKGLEERIIAPIMLQVLQALEYLHKLGIVHRDVKASNILLDRSNVVLGDFGIAACMERRLSECNRQEYGRYLARSSFVGTPVWMAPEVIEQSCGHSMKADIYSFGITLLEMACGKVPFAGMPFTMVAINKLHHPPPTLPRTHEGRHFSADMQHVVALCLERDPAKRPTASQLLQHRFFKWSRGVAHAVEELLAAVPSPVQRFTSLSRRDREAVQEDGESNIADERFSVGGVKEKDAVSATTAFDADTAQILLHRMLASNGLPPSMAASPDSPASSSWTPMSNGGTPRSKNSFSRKRTSSFARGEFWPKLPACALKHCKGILFSSAGRKGFGLQTTWGHGFLLAHIQRGGVSFWSGPCYVYVSGNLKLGMGENIRESVVLFSGGEAKQLLNGSKVFKMNDLKLLDAVGESLDAASICEALQCGLPKCHGVAFRHYSGTKAWKHHGIVHLDELANQRVYGRCVSARDILEGKVKPPASFRGLIDDLIACEEGRFERTSTSSEYGDSDGSSGLRSNRSAPATPKARSRRRSSTYGPDAASDANFLDEPTLSAPISVFSQLLERSQGGSGSGDSTGIISTLLRSSSSAPDLTESVTESFLSQSMSQGLQSQLSFGHPAAPQSPPPPARGGSPWRPQPGVVGGAGGQPPESELDHSQHYAGGDNAVDAASGDLNTWAHHDNAGPNAFAAAAGTPFAAALDSSAEEPRGDGGPKPNGPVRTKSEAGSIARRPPKPPRQTSANVRDLARALRSLATGSPASSLSGNGSVPGGLSPGASVPGGSV